MVGKRTLCSFGDSGIVGVVGKPKCRSFGDVGIAPLVELNAPAETEFGSQVRRKNACDEEEASVEDQRDVEQW